MKYLLALILLSACTPAEREQAAKNADKALAQACAARAAELAQDHQDAGK
jgi:hypothetical protein